MESLDFHQKVRDAYLEVAKRDDRDRWTIVDAAQDIDTIEEKIWEEIQARGVCA